MRDFITAIFVAVAIAEVSAYTSPKGKISADVEAGTGIVISYKADGRDTRLLTLLAGPVAEADTSGPYAVD